MVVNIGGIIWPRTLEKTSSSNTPGCMYTTEAVTAVTSACVGSCWEASVCLENLGTRYAVTACVQDDLSQGEHHCIWMVWVQRRCNSNVFLLNTTDVLCLLHSVCWSQDHTRFWNWLGIQKWSKRRRGMEHWEVKKGVGWVNKLCWGAGSYE